MAKVKTNAMRILDAGKIPYEIRTYEIKDGKIDGVSVAQKIGKDAKEVYKTLVAQGASRAIYVFVIPVAEELNMKKAAAVAGEKKIEMLPVKDIQKCTGYIRGGCSPIGMSKKYPTFIQNEAQDQETIVISGGKIGLQIEIKPSYLVDVVNAQFADFIK